MKNEVKKLFDEVTPIKSDKEILYGVLGKAKEMESTNSNNKIRIKKPIIAVIAAAAAASLGVTGAAAAGLINFDSLFGNRIKAESNELGEALLCKAENFSYTVSDDNYEISLNGISGSATDIIANLEISRKDGTPVIDCFVNEYNPEIGLHGHEECIISSYDKKNYDRFLGSTSKYSINDEGNIEIVYVIGDEDMSAVPVSNETIKIFSAKIYPIEPYFDYVVEEKKAVYMFEDGELTYFENNTDNKIEVDTSSVHYLDLVWSAEFDYIPSEMALKTIDKSYHSDSDKMEVKAYHYENDVETTQDAVIENIDIKLTSTFATFTCDMVYEEPENGDIPFPDIEQIYLIRKDGTKTLMIMNSGHGPYDGGFSISYRYCSYFKDNGDGSFFADYIAVDLNDVTGIEINGKLYEL